MGKDKEPQGLTPRELRKKRRIRNQIVSYIVMVFVVILVAAGVLITARSMVKHQNEKQAKQQSEEQSAVQTTALETEEMTQSLPEEEIKPQEELLEELISTYMKDMTLEEKTAGLFLITPEALTGVGTVIQAGDGTKEALTQFPVGGLVYFSKNIQSEAQLKEMIQNTVSYSKYPLFIGVDEEGGSVSRLAGDVLKIDKTVPMAEIGETKDTTKAQDAAAKIAAYLGDYGFNLDFAPVGDVLTKEGNPIGDRTFSSDPEVAADMVEAFVEGLQSNGISACVKHFPGHGNTEGDSHNGAAVTDKSLEEMRAVEFLPFKAGIESGTDFIMVGHISAPKLVGDNTPCNLSSMIVTEILRNELGYQGIVITDAMNMKAITEQYESDEAAILAIQAGVDIILMPEDFQKAYTGVLEAVKTGKISEERIDESLRRIYRVKYKNALDEAG